MKLSLVVPVYNEAPHLREFLEKLDAFDFGMPKEIIIVDDRSKDASWDIVSGFKFQSPVILHRQELNQGKGAALRKGFALATGEVIIVQDADFEYDMADVPQLLTPIVSGKADICFGSRFRKNGQQVHRTFHYLINRFLTLLSNMLSGLYLSDMETCYKAFRGEIIKNLVLESNRFGFEPEVTAKIARLKVRVMEFPISYFPRNYLEGKKIGWKDGVAALFHIWKFNSEKRAEKIYLPTMPDKYKINKTQWL